MKAILCLAFCAVVLLAGCGPTPEEQRAMDQQKCYGFGYAPGSLPFANCMMTVTQQRDAQDAADRRAAADRDAANQRAQAASQAAKDRADQDAWDKRTGQGKYSSSSGGSPSSSSSSSSSVFGTNPVDQINNSIQSDMNKMQGYGN